MRLAKAIADGARAVGAPRDDLEWLIAELSEFYGPEEARLWLFAPHRLLKGEPPAKRIQDGRIDDVLAILAQLRDGAYV